MFDDPVFFMPQYFECKQANIEYSYNMESKNHCLQKFPVGGGGRVFISGPWTTTSGSLYHTDASCMID